MRDKNNERANLGEQKRRSESESDQVFSRPNLDRDRASNREENQKDTGAKRTIERKGEDAVRQGTQNPRREAGVGGGGQGGKSGSTSGRPEEKVAGKGFTMDR